MACIRIDLDPVRHTVPFRHVTRGRYDVNGYQRIIRGEPEKQLRGDAFDLKVGRVRFACHHAYTMKCSNGTDPLGETAGRGKHILSAHTVADHALWTSCDSRVGVQIVEERCTVGSDTVVIKACHGGGDDGRHAIVTFRQIESVTQGIREPSEPR